MLGLHAEHNSYSRGMLLCARWTHKGVEHEGNSARVFADVAADDSEDESEAFPDTDAFTAESAEKCETCVPDLERVIDTWQRSSILVGMHPDQARSAVLQCPRFHISARKISQKPPRQHAGACIWPGKSRVLAITRK